ncbi:MAG: hypothetical protein IPM85_07545 [Chitinophagaceae bacterium]|nr:hypothetical protein [Chitinophagaceae bacterium]
MMKIFMEADNHCITYLKNAGFNDMDSFYRPKAFGIVYKKNDPSFDPGMAFWRRSDR